MEEQLITFETARLAKEKGFNLLDCNYIYLHNEGSFRGKKGTDSWQPAWDLVEFHNRYSFSGTQYTEEEQFPAPTQSLFQKLLREKQYIDVFVVPAIKEGHYEWSIRYEEGFEFATIDGDEAFAVYEDALEAGLLLVLKKIL